MILKVLRPVGLFLEIITLNFPIKLHLQESVTLVKEDFHLFTGSTSSLHPYNLRNRNIEPLHTNNSYPLFACLFNALPSPLKLVNSLKRFHY